jgi:hypothetical protein
VAHLAGFAVYERVVEVDDMPRRHPDLRVEQDTAVQTHIVGAFAHELLPPRGFDVVQKLDAQRTVIPCVGKTAVDLRAGVYKPAPLAQRHDLIHALLQIIH